MNKVKTVPFIWFGGGGGGCLGILFEPQEFDPNWLNSIFMQREKGLERGGNGGRGLWDGWQAKVKKRLITLSQSNPLN